MIVVRLMGGLGNQMFQYALGRALSVRHATSLMLDTSAFKHRQGRTYRLRRLAIQAGELSPMALGILSLERAIGSRAGKVLATLLQRSPIATINERSFEFDASVLDAPRRCYLSGYWQSPRYFASIEPMLRLELQVREPPDEENQIVVNRIMGCTSIAVHVRRGDYVESATTSRYHGTCSPAYYLAAEAQMRTRLRDPHLFVFSDDPSWAERNLPFVSPATVIRHNGSQRDFEDLRLMALCKHHIIANSTFSWWGAWLSENPNKIVIAPQNWFSEAAHSTQDLIPETWIRI